MSPDVVARLARVVIPGSPHHVTRRGNGRARTFFEQGDFALYLDLLAEAAQRARSEVWAYCLMPNHVHIVLTPSETDGLWRTFGELHRRYTGYVNARPPRAPPHRLPEPHSLHWREALREIAAILKRMRPT